VSGTAPFPQRRHDDADRGHVETRHSIAALTFVPTPRPRGAPPRRPIDRSAVSVEAAQLFLEPSDDFHHLEVSEREAPGAVGATA
jgi:hypothetical protein